MSYIAYCYDTLIMDDRNELSYNIIASFCIVYNLLKYRIMEIAVILLKHFTLSKVKVRKLIVGVVDFLRARGASAVLLKSWCVCVRPSRSDAD